MTAINVIQQSKAIHVITDGLIQGRPFLVSKIWTLPHLNCALTITGGDRSFSLLGKLAYEASLAVGRAEYLFGNLAELVRTCQEKYADKVPNPDGDNACDHFVVTVAAYVQKPCTVANTKIEPGPLSGVVASHPVGEAPPYSLVLYPQQKHWSLCPDVAPLTEQFATYIGGRDLDDIDVSEAAGVSIELQRQRVNPEFPNALGGFAQVTTITESETISRVVRRWPQHLIDAGGYPDDDELL